MIGCILASLPCSSMVFINLHTSCSFFIEDNSHITFNSFSLKLHSFCHYYTRGKTWFSSSLVFPKPDLPLIPPVFHSQFSTIENLDYIGKWFTNLIFLSTCQNSKTTSAQLSKAIHLTRKHESGTSLRTPFTAITARAGLDTKLPVDIDVIADRDSKNVFNVRETSRWMSWHRMLKNLRPDTPNSATIYAIQSPFNQGKNKNKT